MPDVLIKVVILDAKFSKCLHYRLELPADACKQEVRISCETNTDAAGQEKTKNIIKELQEPQDPYRLIGCAVSVPLGKNNRRQKAIIIDTAAFEANYESASAKTDDSYKLKGAYELLSKQPLLNKKQLQLARLISKRYQCTLSHAVNLFLPPLSLQGQLTAIYNFSNLERFRRLLDGPAAEWTSDLTAREPVSGINSEQISAFFKTYLAPLKEDDKELLEKFVKSKAACRLFNALIAAVPITEKDEISANSRGDVVKLTNGDLNAMKLPKKYKELLKCSSNIILSEERVFSALEQRNYTYLEKIMSELPAKSLAKLAKKHELNRQQQAVIGKIQNSYPTCREFLLHGVTGSGKTEIYMELASKQLAKGKSCLILVPEINLSYPMIQKFNLHFKDLCAVWHSQLSAGEKLATRTAIERNEIKILIGTRSAVFNNFRNLGLIVIDEEHDASYISETVPHYDTHSIARLMLRLNKELLLLSASATPSVSSYYRTELGKSKLLELTERAVSVNEPEALIIDLKQAGFNAENQILARESINAINDCLQLKQQVIILLNRRGYNAAFLCQNCGQALYCPNCDFRLVYHKHIDALLCHYCSYQERKRSECPHCRSTNSLITYDFGTEKVAEFCKKTFPDKITLRLDLDVSGKKDAANEILTSFENGEADILIGTQMIAKGHDFSNVGLVCILGIEQTLNSATYLAEERCFQLLCQAAGRAGRQGQSSKIVVQTFDPGLSCIKYALGNDYRTFYQEQLKWRKKLHYPPCNTLAQLKFVIKDQRITKAAIATYINQLAADLRTAWLTLLDKNLNLRTEGLNTGNLVIVEINENSVRRLKNEYVVYLSMLCDSEEALAYIAGLIKQVNLPASWQCSLLLSN